MFTLEMRRLQVHLLATFQYLKGSCKKGGERLFSRICCNRTKGDGFKVKERRFRVNIKKTFVTLRMLVTLAEVPPVSGRFPIHGNIAEL